MKPRSLVAAVAALLGALASPLAGQEFQIRGLSLESGLPAPEVYVHHADGAPDAGVIQVKSFLNHEFDTLKLKGRKVVLTTKPGAASAKDPELLVGTCELPAKGGSAILLFLPEKPGSPACKLVVLEDGKKAFPPGSIKVANLSSLPVRIELQQKPFDFKAGEIRNIEDMPVDDSQNAGMRGTCEVDGKWELFSSGKWPHPGSKRVLQVLVDNPTTKLVDIRGVRDVAAP